MYKLRQYQEDAVNAILDHFQNGSEKDHPIVVAPTGSGKSLLVANVANILKEDVLVFQPSKELLEQNYSKFEMYGGTASIYSASAGVKEIGSITFAMIGSVKSISNEFSHVKYVIIDECHLVPPNVAKINKNGRMKKGSTFMTFLSKLEGVKVVGLTATAFRLKKYRDVWTNVPYSQINLLPRERPCFFNKFLHVTQIRELFDQGYLCPLKYIELGWSDKGLKVNTTGAEFTDASMDVAMKQQGVIEQLPQIIRQSIEKGRKHRLVFVKNVVDAIYLSQRVPFSASVHSGTNKRDRERILEDFKSGKIKTVFNVGVLTTGFDFPELDTIIIGRPTMSLTLYIQMVGRGIRLAEGKEYCALVDMCGSIRRFGKIEDMEYVQEPKGWVFRNKERVLTGVPLDKK